MILTVILSFQWAVASAFYLPRCKTVSAHEDVRNSGRCSWWLKFSRSFSAAVNMLLGRTGAPDTSSVEVNIRTCRSGRGWRTQHTVPSRGKKKKCLISDIMSGALQSYIGFPLMSVCCKNCTLEWSSSHAICTEWRCIIWTDCGWEAEKGNSKHESGAGSFSVHVWILKKQKN